MNFKEKLAKITEINKNRADNLEQDKNRWIQEVNKLYKNIEDWFNEYINEDYMAIEFNPLKHIEYEEFIDNIRIMELELGRGPSVILEPTGINVIGAFGKIDLYLRGHKDEKVFLLLVENGDEKTQWELWKSRKDTKLFNKNTFEELLDEWLDKWTGTQKE
ncbi:MAG: hypothetical protein GY795_26720 [Desulfobacterales bacterium]|nr:hypothetical protein [Desulfobacterales bacterium]